MKFTTFLKIFGIALGSFVGAVGIGIGIMAIGGAFSEPNIQPAEISFEYSEYKEDSDFEVKITTKTENVTKTEIALSFPNASEVTEKDGKISDGVITIPKTVKLGQKFKVELVKVINDAECEGQDWIKGGHSVIRATSSNPEADSARAVVHIDVPVYNVEIETKVSENEQDSNIFVLDTAFYANIKFYPQRSAYQYSFDGNNGYDKIAKNAYFMLATGNDTYISQVGTTNEFTANEVGNNSVINGYVFGRTKREESVLNGISAISGQERHNAILQEIRNILSDRSQNKEAFSASKSVDIIDIDVDRLVSNVLECRVPDVYVATKYTAYANNKNATGALDMNLALKLLSNYDENVSLQSKLNNVGITFLYKQGSSFYKGVNNDNAVYNVIEMPQGGYGRVATSVEDEEEYTYFFPVITSSVDNYHWEFAVSRYCETDSIYIKIKYFDNELEIEPVLLSFSTKIVVSNAISWSSTDDVELTIIDGEEPVYEDYDIKSRAVVPQANLYQTKKYFAYSSNNQALTDYIYAKEPVTYTLGSQGFDLYELTDGIIQPHSKSAHGVSFNVIFVTVQTDYNGREILVNDKYVINQYSQDSYGAISPINVSITKTLYSISYNLVTSDDEADLIKFTDDATGFDALAYVDGTLSPFDIIVSYQCEDGKDDEIEKNIFRQAIVNEDITVVAKTSVSSSSEIVSISNVTEQIDSGKLLYRFSMTVKELPAGTSDLRIGLYVAYNKGGVDELYKVDKYNEEKDLSYIEVYNGEAVTFAFNLNICDDGQYVTSSDRPVNVQTTLESSLRNQEYYIDSITTQYKVDNIQVHGKLFETFGTIVDYGHVNVVVQDKHGKYPKSSIYTLESSNPSVLVVTDQNTIVFTGTGNAELRLLHKKDSEFELKDKLYFTSLNEGSVSKVTKYQFLADTPVIEFEKVSSDYEFKTITIPVNGYAGLIINFNNTSLSNNLLTYYYSYGVIESSNLINQMLFTLANLDDLQLQDSEHVEFYKDINENLTAIEFKKDFGQRRTIQILVTVPQLGISQIVILDIKPNVVISVTPKDNPVVTDPKGSAIYNGVQLTPVYADSVYKVEVVLDYTIKPTSSSISLYNFVIYNTDSQTSESVWKYDHEADQLVYIAKICNITTGEEVIGNDINDVSVKRNGDYKRYVFEYYFVFTSQAETLAKTLILSLKQSETTVVDTQKDLYLSINQNVKVELNGDNDLYLNTQYLDGIYGTSTLYGEDSSKIKLSRIVNNGDVVSQELKESLATLDRSISINIMSNVDKFNISGYKLSSTSPITNFRTVELDILYNNATISTISLNVRPNATKNLDSDLWVLYGKDDIDYYLSLVSNKSYSYEDLLEAFEYNFDGYDSIGSNVDISIDFANDFVKNYLSQVTDAGGYSVQVATVDDRIVTDIQLYGQLIFKNGVSHTDGDRIIFKIIILPCDLPFVLYPNIDINYTQENLYDILDLEYLTANIESFHYTATNSGNLDGEYILFDNDGDFNSKVGIQNFDNANIRYEVKNLVTTDVTNYAYIDQSGILHTEAVGEDTFIVVYAVLNELQENSLVIPYIVKIPRELVIQTYYPYTQYASQNDYNLCGEDMLASEPTFDMEYLAFQSGYAQIDMFEKFSQNIPNYKNVSRYAIGKNIDGRFQRVENLSALSEIEFKVTEVWYYAPGWRKAQNVGNYATFSSNTNGNGLLTINQFGGTEKLRLRIEITTQSKIMSAYYISVGEIPSLILTDRNGTTASSILNVNAADSIDIGIETYRLLKEVKNGRTDATHLLDFYSIAESYEEPNITINNENNTITTSPSTTNWQTDLVAYTIYGQVCIVVLKIKSNYEICYFDNEILEYDENEKLYKVNSGSVINVLDVFVVYNSDGGSYIDKASIADCKITLHTNYSQIFATNDCINVGSVSSYTLVDVDVVYQFVDAAKEFNFGFTLKVMPYVMINTYNNIQISRTNMFSIEDIYAGQEQTLDIMANLFKFGSSTQSEEWSEWIYNIMHNNLGGFDVTLITENISSALFSASILPVDNVYKIQVNTSPVAIQTRIAFKVSLYNNYDGAKHELLASYFTFTIAPTFKLIINYPKPNNNAVVAGETYHYNPGITNNINFNEEAIFADGKRIIIDSLFGNFVSSNDIYITTTSDYIKSGPTQLNSIPNGIPLSEALFTIDGFTSNEELIVFGIHFKVDDDTFTVLGSYNLLLCQTNDVFTAIMSNYNNIGVNEIGRPEAIYIGNNSYGVKDNVMTRIKVSIKIPTNAVIQKDLHIIITKIGGIEVVCLPASFGNGSSGETFTLNTFIDSDTIGRMTSSTVEYSIYEQVDEDNTIECNLYDTFGNVVEPTFTPSSRISLVYKALTSVNSSSEQISSEVVDFFKMYNVLNIDEINISESDIENSEETFKKDVKLGEIYLGKYYIDYKFDIQFETQYVSLSTGESTTLLRNSDSISSNYYRSLFNMKRLSDGTYYKKEDFANDGLKFDYVESVLSVYTSNPQTPAPAYGYLSMTPVISDGNLFYDYIFLAMGSPKEDSITVTLKVVVKYGSTTKKFDMTFVVRHDYENEYLRNSNDTVNRQTDRNKLLAGESYIFAIAGSTNQLENFVYITHSNKTMDIYSGNVASFFSIIFDNDGRDYVEGYTYNSNYDLSIQLKNLYFGNVNLDIVFRDAYGYQFTYYVQIVAKYNPTYDAGSKDIYERDVVKVINSTDAQGQGFVNLPISIDKQDGENDLLVRDIDSITLEFIPNEKWKNGRMEKNTYSIPNLFTPRVETTEDNNRIFETSYIKEEWFKIGETQEGDNIYTQDIAGKLIIHFAVINGYQNYSTKIVIDAILKERYSLRTSTTPYVRDDVPFSLVDIVDVVDNKSSITIGDRSLRNVKSIYLEYSVISENEGPIENPFDSDNNFSNNFSLSIKALNKNKGTETTKQIADKSGSYISLLSLFDIESVDMLKNYSFKMHYDISNDVVDSSPYGWTTNIRSEAEYREEQTHLERSVTIAEKIKAQEGGGPTPEPSFRYTFTISVCYISDDQELSLAVQKVDNLSEVKVKLISTTSGNVRFVHVPATKTEIKTISLRTEGLINNVTDTSYELYTSADRTVIRGIENEELLRLKGIIFDDSSEGCDTIINNTVKKYITKSEDEEENPTFKVSTDGNNVLYNEGTLKIDVKYAYMNGEPAKKKDGYTTKLRITLKFVDLDTTHAYGSDIARKILYYKGENGEGEAQIKENGVELQRWAGVIGDRPIYVVSGYTDATSFANDEKTTLFENCTDFSYSINTTQSTAGSYVTIDNTGKITLVGDKNKFDFEHNYIAIDVKVLYGERKDNEQLIDTVLVKFRDIQAGKLTAIPKAQKLVVVGTNETTSLKVAEMISLTDSSDSYWSGQKIIDAFGTNLLWASYAIENRPRTDEEFNALGFVSFDDADNLGTLIVSGTKTNIAIRAIGQLDELILLEDLTLVNSEFGSNCISADDEYNFSFAPNPMPTYTQIYDKLSTLVKFKNIYNEYKTAQECEFVQCGSAINQNVYSIVGKSETDYYGEKFVYTVTFGCSNSSGIMSKTYGSVIVRVFASSDNILPLISTTINGLDSDSEVRDIFTPLLIKPEGEIEGNYWSLEEITEEYNNHANIRVIKPNSKIIITGISGVDVSVSGASKNYDNSNGKLTLSNITFNNHKANIQISIKYDETNIVNKNLIVYDDVFECIQDTYRIDKSLLHVRLVKTGTENFENCIALQNSYVDTNDNEQQSSDYTIKVYKTKPDGNISCKLEVYFTYVDDFSGQEVVIVVYQNNYTFTWYQN